LTDLLVTQLFTAQAQCYWKQEIWANAHDTWESL